MTGYGEQTLRFMQPLNFGKSQFIYAYHADSISCPYTHGSILSLNLPQSKLTWPEECQELLRPPGIFHIELFYAWRCHYDVIILSDGYISDYTPPLPEPQLSEITL